MQVVLNKYYSDCSLIENITTDPMAYPPPLKYSLLQEDLSPQQQYPLQSTAADVSVVQAESDVDFGSVTCPSCQNNVTPRTETIISRNAWSWVFLLFLLGFLIPICWL